MTVPYYTGGVSTNYHLPIIDPSDSDKDGVYDTIMSATLEQRYASIIENGLYGTSRCLLSSDYNYRGYGVIYESDFFLTYSGNNISCACASLQCIINNVYINTSTVVWNDLIRGVTYYLYVALKEDDRIDWQGDAYISSREHGDVLAYTKDHYEESNIELFMGIVTPPNY